MMKSATLGFLFLASFPALAQIDTSIGMPEPKQQTAPTPGNTPSEVYAEVNPLTVNNDTMVTPAAVSVEGVGLQFEAESARSNYVNGGLSFGSAYDDNVSSNAQGRPLSDVTYSISPFIGLNLTRPRTHWNFFYGPGFTFYQRTSSRNQADHNFSLDYRYRLSPHLTFTLTDGFSKSSGLLNQYTQATSTSVGGIIPGQNNSIVAPVSERISNLASAQLTYQLGANEMVGASGTYSRLWYPNVTEAGGLRGSQGRSGSLFYTYRLSGRHYIGATYQYQFLSTSGIQGETQSQSGLFFYTLYLQPKLSISAFGGPEYSESTGSLILPQNGMQTYDNKGWSPSAGGSVSWQAERTSLNAGFERRVSDGGGLTSAVRANNANGAIRQQFSRNWNGSILASYSTNRSLSPPGAVVNGSSNGHSVQGTVSVQRLLGEHFNVQLGFTKLHQSYSGLTFIAPDRNRVWGSLNYTFQRPIGR